MTDTSNLDHDGRLRYLDHIEQAIRAANHKIIHKHIPKLTTDDVLKLAMTVAELRARYLQQALKLVERAEGVAPDASELARLAKVREGYDEATAAFEALRRAIERGYVDVT